MSEVLANLEKRELNELPALYSSTERVVGTRNGQLVYEKTITGGCPQVVTDGTPVNLAIGTVSGANNDVIITECYIEGVVGTTTYRYYPPYFLNNGNSIKSSSYNNTVRMTSNATDFNSWSSTFVVRYTKATS